jgi:hypothetical protein
MSTIPPTPPTGSRDDRGRADARVFFEEYYRTLAEVPQTPYERDIQLFEAKHGTVHGYTRDDLNRIVKAARDEARKTRVTPDQSNGGQPENNPRLWEKWIRGVAFGVYILAALGTVFYAALFLKLGWSIEALQPYIAGLVALGAVLLILSVAWSVLKRTTLSRKVKEIFAGCILALALAVLTGAVIWIVTIMLQLAGWIEKPSPKAVAPPGEFTYQVAWTCSDDKNLPNELFGDFKDDVAKPREWMRSFEAGSRGMLQDPASQVCWLLTKEKANTKYETRINVGTQDDIVILAFAVIPRPDSSAPASLIPLRQVPSANEAEYGFVAPVVQEPCPILFLVAMRASAFKKWHDEHQNFVIKS